MCVGGYYNTTFSYGDDLIVDELSVHNGVVLSLAQIQEIYNSGKPIDLNRVYSGTAPTHWWRFGDGSGDAADGTVYDQGSSVSNLTTYNMESGDKSTDVPQFTNGFSMFYDGSDDISKTPSTIDMAGDFTICLWHRPGTLGGSFQLPIFCGKEGNNTWSKHRAAFYYWSWNAGWYVGDGSSYDGAAYTDADADPVLSEWRFYALTYDDSTATFYYGDAGTLTQDSTHSWSRAWGGGNIFLSVGGTVRDDTGSASYLSDPYIDEIQIHNSVLTQTQIEGIYNSGAPKYADLSPSHWYRMGDVDTDGATSVIYDQGSVGSNLSQHTGAPAKDTSVPS